MTPPRSVVILGAGPAACTLAALVARRGARTLVLDDGQRPDLIVGESLIPAVVPLLRKLELEQRVAAISQHKPGVSFLHSTAPPIHFNFAPIARYLPTYAYNVERRSFDALLKTRAIELGAVFVPARGSVVPATPGSGRELELDAASLQACQGLDGQQPDYLIDATGRHRLFSSVLGIPAAHGTRNDIACFAHYEDFEWPEPRGQVLISRLESGWSWRIPLPGGRMSFGIVMQQADAKALGDTPEARLEAVLHGDADHRHAAARARRVSPVAVYRNYQRIGTRAFGPGWAAVGDAFGFVDPMLSSGLFLAMEAADKLDAALAGGSPQAMTQYESGMRRWYRAWADLIDYFYDGRMYSLYLAGHLMKQRRSNKLQHALDRFLNKHIACMASGARTRARSSRTILRLAARLLTIGSVPAPRLAIR
jgi:flavin-dependent dehydrogenase